MKNFLNFKNINSVVFIILLTIFLSIFTLVYQILTGNNIQNYNDFILEWTSAVCANKSSEVFLIYFLSFIGIISCLLFGLIKQNSENKYNPNKLILYVFSGFTLLQIIFYAKFLFLPFLLFLIFLYNKKVYNLFEFIILFFIHFYCAASLYRIYVYLGGNCSFTVSGLYFLSLFLSFISIVFKDKLPIYKIVLIEQLFIPFLLLIFLCKKYKYIDNIITLEQPFQVKFLIYILLILSLCEFIYLVKKHWKTINEYIISLSSCIGIIGFNLFNNIGAVAPTDMHHPFENIIGYHQIIQMGQIPFKEYIPVSGFYSVFHGGLFNIFGNDNIVNYYITDNILYLLICILTVVLLNFHVKRNVLLLISCLFIFLAYDRIIFILPIMLTLTLPALIKNENLWLKIWILTSLLHGLYYPVFGASVCLAFFPLGIYQFIRLLKTNKYKSITFWLSWMLCIIPVLISIPYLIGTYNHIKNMADQTILADGIARFGQLFGQNFIPYLPPVSFIKLSLITILTFIIPALFVWIATLIFTENIKNNIEKALITLSLIIYPLVSYTYTTVRLDVDDIFARSCGVLLIGAVMMMVFALKYIQNKPLKYFIFVFCLFIPFISNNLGILKISTKFNPYYKISDDYILIEHNRLGKGFVSNALINYSSKYCSDLDRSKSYFGNEQFAFFYICNVKGSSVMETTTLKSYNAVKETTDLLKNNDNIVVGNYINALQNYYLFNWLMTSGEYIWNNNNEFIKNTNQNIINNTNETITKDDLNVEKNSNSLGKSMSSLYKIFTNKNSSFITKHSDNKLVINFDNQVNGNDADFMYIEFYNINKNPSYAVYNMKGYYNVKGFFPFGKYLMKKNYNSNLTVMIEWSDNKGEIHRLFSDMGDGKLLIPLGAGRKWLLNKHSYISISVLDNGKTANLPEINKIEFLELRKVR